MRDEWIAAGHAHWPHFIRVDPDFDADGIWSERGAAFALKDIAISEDLHAAFRAWQDFYDSLPVEVDLAPEVCAYLDTTGKALARQLKTERPDCVVVAFDRRVRANLEPGERVPWPGEGWDSEGSGKPYARWKAAYLSGDFEK